MTNEEKQALIAWAHKWIEPAKRTAANNPQDESAKASLALYEIALATLTAQPVKLAKDLKLSDKAHQSHCDYAEGYNDRAEMDRNAIRAAGYEVQE